MKKHRLIASLALCIANWAIGMQTTPVGSGDLTKQEKQIHHDLFGKVKKLDGYDDIYVGSGYSAAGEPMFFGMEELDDKRAQVWKNYVDALCENNGVVSKLKELSCFCQDEEWRKELKEQEDFYRLGLMDTICPNKLKFSLLFDISGGMRGGLNGFKEMLVRQRKKKVIYVAYASTQPITSPFKPKKEIGASPALEEFEAAYYDIIVSIGIDMEGTTPKTEHRGIFKNPFVEIKGTYKNIGLKLHGWAGAVEGQMLDKKYMTVCPTPKAAELLQRSVKAGDMYIGVDTEPYPYDDKELEKKFPSIKKEFIGIDGCGIPWEKLHVFDLNVLSKYYTESSGKK